MLYLVYLLVIASILFLAQSFRVQNRPKSLPILELTEQVMYQSSKRPLLFRILKFAAPLNKTVVTKLGREKFTQRIVRAGFKLLPEEFLLAWELSFIGFYLFIYYFAKNLFGRMDMALSFVVILAGFVLPDIWLRFASAKRKARIIRVLPDAIDLVALCVNAGLDFSLAIKWIIDKSQTSPLTDEFSLFLLETKMGKSRIQALRDMSKRVNLPEMSSFSRAIAQAERLGIPIEAALNALAEDIREIRFRKGEKVALLAPLKMLFPLLFFIMPVVAIIVGGPIVLQFLTTGLSTKF